MLMLSVSTMLPISQYVQFVEDTGYRQPLYWSDERFNGEDYPVVGVSWYDAPNFRMA